MKRRVFICLLFIVAITRAFSTDQIHDILIIGKDTIFLKTFPLEELHFAVRPFQYGRYDFPSTSCYRGYQATWQVVDKQLFLRDIHKVGEPDEKADLVNLFAANGYSPTMINGMVLANWFSIDLRPFPTTHKFMGCVWKSKRSKKCKPSIRFESGRMVYNRYKGN